MLTPTAAQPRGTSSNGKSHFSSTDSDAVARIYLDWIKDTHKDPDVQSNWIPTGGVFPTTAQIGRPSSCRFAAPNWIMYRCSTFRNDGNFVAGAVPIIGSPTPGVNLPVVPIPVPHTSVAGNFLVGALQNPPLA